MSVKDEVPHKFSTLLGREKARWEESQSATEAALAAAGVGMLWSDLVFFPRLYG